MNIKSDYKLSGIKLLELKVFADDRGFFTERFRASWMSDLGLTEPLVQDNFSRSKFGTLRGLHYQHSPGQAKLVTCLTGSILDVVVDIRKNSPTLGQFECIPLSGAKPECLVVPAGFAHGFIVTSSEGADVLYKVDSFWNPKTEGSILWSDPDLNIPWPQSQPLLSAKDAVAASWKSYLENPIF